MNLLQRVGEWIEKRNYTSSPEFLYGLGMPSAAGPVVTESNALTSGAVWACVRIISETIASLPLILYEQQGETKQRATSHPAYGVLHDLANSEMTALEQREIQMAHALTWGVGFAEKQYDGRGNLTALWPMRPDRFEEAMWRGTGQNKRLWWKYRLPDNMAAWLPADRLLTIRGLSFDGVWSYSPIRMAAKDAIGLSLATEKFGSKFFANGARVGGVLKTPGKLSPRSEQNLRDSINIMHQGLDNAHRMMILEEGLDYGAVGIPPEEAQFLETRKFQVTEIARIFRVPPHMLADLERATFSNIEHQSIEFVMHTLRPWLVRIEQAIYRDILEPSERGRYFAKHNVEGLLRGDTASRMQAYNTAILSGHMSPNEARELEDRNRVDGLDYYLSPLNMIQIGPDAMPLPEPEPPAPPAEPEPDTEPEEGEEENALPVMWETRAIRAATDRRAIMNRHIRLFHDVAERVVKRETNDIRRALPRYLGKRSISEFENWLEGFYQELRRWMPDYYRSLMETYAETMLADVANELDGDPAPLDDELREWIEGYLANFTSVYAVGAEKQLRALLAEAESEEDAEAAISQRMDGWEETRADKTALDQAFEAGNALVHYGLVAGGVEYLRWAATGESCPLCQSLDGRRIPVDGSFVSEGDTVEAEGVDPLPIVRTIRHAPLHGGCDCVIVRA